MAKKLILSQILVDQLIDIPETQAEILTEIILEDEWIF